MKRTSELIPSAYHGFWQASKNQEYLRYVLSGGRGSGKSTCIGFRLITDIITTPVSALVVRKVANTLYESVYQQLVECIQLMGLTHLFRFSKSPLQIVYVPRGNKILFRGMDNPQKIKSIKVSQFPIGILWVEEMAEIANEDDLDVVEQSVLRGELPQGIKYKMYYSYNPPKRRNSWVNSKYSDIATYNDPTLFRLHTTYLDNPFISKASIKEAERMKQKSEMKYKYVFLGEPVGSGIVPFDNLSIREITKEEIANFDNIRQGLDFGFATDPCAFIRLHYDKTRRKIYIFDELYKVKMFNSDIANELIKKGYNRTLTICDSAEPKSIAELKRLGCNVIGAKKGQDSVEYGEKWLDSLEEIVIDPVRCPNTAREFAEIDFQSDKDGNPLPRLIDKNNHTIDGVRYSLNRDMNNTEWKVY